MRLSMPFLEQRRYALAPFSAMSGKAAWLALCATSGGAELAVSNQHVHQPDGQ
jgi:hypothetical protein